MSFRHIVLVFMVLGLGACSSVPKVPSFKKPFSKSKAETPAQSGDSATIDNKVESPIAPTPPRFLEADLLGLDARQLDDILGAPKFVRREGAGQFRRYGNSICNLVIILQRDVSGRTVSTDLKSMAFLSGNTSPQTQECLNNFE